MSRRKRRAWKAVPQLSPYEKGKAKSVGEMIKEGIDPLRVTVSSGLGSHSYNYKDVAHYIELSHRPFNQTVTLFNLKGDTNEEYERTRAVQ